MRYGLKEKAAVFYHGRRSGLTDVKISIYDYSGNTYLNSGAMTEIGNTGIYRYTFVPPRYERSYIAVMDSDSAPKKVTEPIIVGPTAKTGGLVKTVKKDTWTEEEKNSVLQALDKLYKAIQEKVLQEVKNDGKLTEKILEEEIASRNAFLRTLDAVVDKIELTQKLIETVNSSNKQIESKQLNILNKLSQSLVNLKESIPKEYDDTKLMERIKSLNKEISELKKQDRVPRVLIELNDLREEIDDLKKAFVARLPTKAVERIYDGKDI